MDNKTLSAADICRIIKQCHTSGVASFAMSGVTINFHPRRNEDAAMPGQASDYQEPTTVVSEFSESQRDQAELMNEDTLLEAEEAQLLIDDPHGFEKAQMDKHIERARISNEKTYS
jgi:hypothetical protein